MKPKRHTKILVLATVTAAREPTPAERATMRPTARFAYDVGHFSGSLTLVDLRHIADALDLLCERVTRKREKKSVAKSIAVVHAMLDDIQNFKPAPLTGIYQPEQDGQPLIASTSETSE